MHCRVRPFISNGRGFIPVLGSIINSSVVSISFHSAELVLGFSATSYSGSEGVSVMPRVEVKSGHLAPSLSVDVTFGNSDGTAIS